MKKNLFFLLFVAIFLACSNLVNAQGLYENSESGDFQEESSSILKGRPDPQPDPNKDPQPSPVGDAWIALLGMSGIYLGKVYLDTKKKKA